MTEKLDKNQKNTPLEKNSRLFSWVQALVALVAVILSVGISYGIVATKISSLEAADVVIEKRIDAYNKVAFSRHEKLDEEIRILQLEQNSTKTQLKNISKTLQEVRYDVKRLLQNRRGN